MHSGGIQPEEGAVLTTLAVLWGGPVFEIGVEYGNSTQYIADGLQDGSRIYSCDIQDVRYYRPKGQVFYPYKSIQVTPPEPCAWAFIDGDHSYVGVVSDIAHCEALGITRLVFHDAREDDPCRDTAGQAGTDVLAACHNRLKGYTIRRLDTTCGILIAEKKCPTSPSD
jgi:hypothetical protein